MESTFAVQTLSVTIDRGREEVYAFAVDPRNLPTWASSFIQSIRQVDGRWVMETSRGPAAIRFVERNTLGVLDHYVSPAPGQEVYVPMRVVENGSGSEVMLTLFRTGAMTEEMFIEDAGMVLRDLRSLKMAMEKKA